MYTEEKDQIKKTSLSGSVVILLALTVLLGPLATFPYFSVSASQALVLIVLLAGASLLAAAYFLKKREFTLPRGQILYGGLFVLLAYILSAFTSVHGVVFAFAGYELGPSTAGVIFFATLAFVLTLLFVRSANQVFIVLASVLVAALLIVVLFLLSFVVKADVVGLWLPGAVSSPLSLWSSVAVYLATALILSVVWLDLASIKNRYLNWSLAGLAGAMVFILMAINILWIWLTLAVLLFFFIVWQLMDVQADSTSPTVSILMVMIAVGMMFFGGLVSDGLRASTTFSDQGITPPWSITEDIIRGTLSENPVRFLLGVGPTGFDYQWRRYMPTEVNLGVLWNIDFAYGSGFLPSAAVSVGTLGLLAFALLIFLYLLSLKKVLSVYARLGKFDRSMLLASVLTALFLLVSLFLSNSSAAVLVTAFIFLALPTALSVGYGLTSTVSWTIEPRGKNLAPALSLVVAVSLLVILTGTLTQRLISSAIYNHTVLNFSQRDLPQAEAKLLQAVNLSVQDRYLRSLSEVYLLDFRQKVADFVEAVDGFDESELQLNRDLIHIRLNRAQDWATLAVANRPTNYRNYRSLYIIHRARYELSPSELESEYDKAVSNLEEAMRHSPNNPQLYLDRAQLELLAGNLDLARDSAQEALRLKRNYANAVFLIAQIEAGAGQIEESLSAMREAVRLAPNDPGLYFQLGLLYRQNQQLEPAERSFARSVALVPDFSNGLYFWAITLAELGQRNQALSILRGLLEDHADNQNLRQTLANVEAGRMPLFGLDQGALPVEEDLPDELEEIDPELEEALDLEDL